MDAGEQRQLREWADRLCAVPDDERRAMGRAIAMLLDRIEELEQELAASASGDSAPQPPAKYVLDPMPLTDALDAPGVGEDTQQLTLRDRLRIATDHLRDRGDR